MPRKDTKYEILDIIQNFSINPLTRELYLHGNNNDLEKECSEIDFRVSLQFIKNLQYLLSASEEKPIIVHMSTVGGDWGAGIAIYDAISAAPCHIYCIVHGEAYSMGSIILQAADTRLMMPNAYCMVHEGTIELNSTTQKVASSTMAWCQELKKVMLDMYGRVIFCPKRQKGTGYS
jgi:ATP-dependent protease ClpP protease subunit